MKVHAWALLGVWLVGCNDGGARPEPEPCDDMCLEGVAVRGVRETMKFVFNLTLQGKPVGAHDVSLECPLGGRARIFGSATSNADQGSTFVDLTYELEECGFAQQDDEPDEAYTLVSTGTFTQRGTLAVQPSATTALLMASPSATVRGTVYDPAAPYQIEGCKLSMVQSGNQLTGSVCDRPVGFGL